MRALDIIKALRLPEITVKTGFILIGSLMTLATIGVTDLAILIELFVVSLLSGLAIYCINAFYGYIPDQHNDRLKTLQLISQRSFGIMALILVIIILGWMIFKTSELFIVTTLVFLLWTIYVHPLSNLKGRVIGGITIAFCAQLLHFRIGVLYVGGDLLDLITESVYFALIFTGGHVWHELIDWEADKNSGNTTTAIILGKAKAVWLAELFFMTATFWWIYIAFRGAYSPLALSSYILAYIVQKIIFYRYGLHNDQSPNKIEKFRKLYLLVFFIATFVLLWHKQEVL